jgi:GrpB-like predicted nucleotidyltransferase (UPF0157 family)
VSDDRPAWADEKPELSPYDPAWPARADTDRRELATLLGPWLTGDVEHIGSTSVPGLTAKPIVDLMAAAPDLDATVAATGDRLAEAGWWYVPPALDGRPWRRFFVKPDATGTRRLAHLHVIAAGHPRYADQLTFRDALRADPALAARYAGLKQRLSAEHHDDREAYTEAKAGFVTEVLARG